MESICITAGSSGEERCFNFYTRVVAKMTIYEIRVIAGNMGIDPKKKKKADLIKAIQTKEGHIPCFKTAGNSCDQEDCCWRSDCLKQKA